MHIVNDRLDTALDRIDEIPSRKREKPLEPDTVVVHYTAGSTASSAINTFIDPGTKACAHLVLDTDGSLTQLVPFDRCTWHAGVSRHLDREGLNAYSIGIEIVNAGRLKKTGSVYTSWFSKEYTEEEVFLGIHRNENTPTYWHRYTEAQITAAAQLCSVLRDHYGIRYLLGHEEIAPGRKTDPGPAFPLDKIRNRVMDLDDRSTASETESAPLDATGIVMASKLNIRSGPGAGNAVVARPLTRGRQVRIHEEKDGWYRVAVEVEGWVSGNHVERD